MQNIWDLLTLDNIFKTVEESTGHKLSNICIKRNSYINRVYELEYHDSRDRLIVKFYRPGRWTKEMILEEHAFIEELFSTELPVIPPLKFSDSSLFMIGNIPYAIFPKKGGRALDEFDEDRWKEIGRMLGRLHLISMNHKQSNRILWKPSVATMHHADVLMQTKAISLDFEKAFFDTVKLFVDYAEPQFDNFESILLHGDCHRGNFIHRPGEGVFIVDFDDMSVGPPVQDLWMLLPDVVEKVENELNWFFEGYETFKPFNLASLKLIPLLRGMRLIHFASWCAVQKDEPHFGQTFPDWGSKRYWNELIKDLQGIVYAE